MRIKSEDEIKDQGFRAGVIKEIEGTENKRRRNEMFKRYEVLKDQTDLYVRSLLRQQFDLTTIEQMQFASTNISVTRKIVSKKARVYNNGVKRTLPKKGDTKKLEELTDVLDINEAMKKTNRYLETFKNTLVYIEPIQRMEEDKEKWDVRVRPMPPHLYDVIPDPHDLEKPLVVILSDFAPDRGSLFSISPANEGRTINTRTAVKPVVGDKKDQVIADDPRDADLTKGKEYIWWSPSFNFKTDEKGNIISETDGTNPIKKLPFVNFAEDQDGEFWALGGDDITDGGIKINALLTHINFISILQGYGQFVATGKNLPKHFKIGPANALLLEYDPEAGQPAPTANYINANAPVGELLQTVEAYVALLLTTNNLSTSGFASNLQGGSAFPSGIAIMIDKSESIEDVQDDQQIFMDGEPMIWKCIVEWLEFFGGQEALIENLQKLVTPSTTDVMLKFAAPQPIISELDKLAAIEKRKELGINTMVELLMLDDPSLNEKDAEEKLLKILAEKAERQAQFIINGPKDEEVPNAPNQENQEDDKEDDQENDQEPEIEGNNGLRSKEKQSNE